MPGNNSKYIEEFTEQIAVRILQTGQSATSLAEEMKQRIKELEKQLKEKDKEIEKKNKQLADEREKIETLKIPAHLHATIRMKFESILEFSIWFDVKKMCEVLGVNRSSYYRWLKGQKKREEKI